MVETVSGVPSFIPALLVFIFLVVLIGGTINQKRRTGTIDMPMWTAIASLVTFVTSLILSLSAGLIQIETISIVIAITILSGFWLAFDRNRNEV